MSLGYGFKNQTSKNSTPYLEFNDSMIFFRRLKSGRTPKAYNSNTHFEYLAMPGGDKANKENWRMGISYLYNIFDKDFMNLDIPI